MIGEKLRDDIRNKVPEAVVKPFVARIEKTMLRHQPIGVFLDEGAQHCLGHAKRQAQGRLILKSSRASRFSSQGTGQMGINTERDIEANMQIGPTDTGMVRIFVEAQGVEIPMDFDPEEADEIAEELRAAAAAARSLRK